MSLKTPLADICLCLCLKSSTCDPGTVYLTSCVYARFDVDFDCGKVMCPLDGANMCLVLIGLSLSEVPRAHRR